MKSRRPLKLQRCYEVAFSNTGAFLITLSGDVVAWNVHERSKRFRVHPFSHPSHCAVHPNDSRLAVKSTSGQIALLDADDGTLVRMLDDTKSNEGSNILYSSCGSKLVDGSWNGQLTVRSAESGQISFQRGFPGEMITRIARTATGDRWFVVHQPKSVVDHKPPASAFVSVWGWPFEEPQDRLMHREGTIKDLAVSPDGSRLCLLGHESITVVRLADNGLLASGAYTYGGTQFVATWSPDGHEIATVQKDSFVFYAANTAQPSQTIDLAYASDIAYSPDGKLLALGSWSSGMLIERAAAQKGAPVGHTSLREARR